MPAVDVETLFQTFADDFMAGEHLAFSQSFAHPLIVYLPFEIRIQKTTEDTLFSLSDCLASARMAGATTIRSSARVETGSTGVRLPVNVTWTFFTQRNLACGTISARFYMRSESGQPARIELIEIFESNLLAPAPRAVSVARH